MLMHLAEHREHRCFVLITLKVRVPLAVVGSTKFDVANKECEQEFYQSFILATVAHTPLKFKVR